jgi:hypothetical protein
MKPFYAFIWNFCEDFYHMTGLRAQAPIEFFFPDFGPWLFSKMIGTKGEEV